DGGEVNRTFARNQRMMHSCRSDVFEMEMAYIGRQAQNRRSRLVSDTIEMSDIEVKPQSRRIGLIHQFQKLVGGFNEESRLGFDEQQDTFSFGMLSHGLELLHKLTQCRRPGTARFNRSARLGSDRRSVQLARQGEAPDGMFDPDTPIVPIRFDPRRMPVFLT